MPKHKLLAVCLSTFAVWALILLSLPQGVSDASNIQQAGTVSPTFTPSPTPIQLIVEVPKGNLRHAPGLGSKITGIVLENTRLTVMGVAEYGDTIWYLVQIEGTEQAWVSEQIVSIAADLDMIPTINLTEFFSRTATPTWTPGGPTATRPRPTRTPTATQTPVRTVDYTATFNAPTSQPTNRPATQPPKPTSTKRPPTNVPTVRPPTNTPVSQPTNRPPTSTLGPSPTNPPPPTSVPPTNIPPTNIPPTIKPPTATAPPLPTNPPPPTSVPPTNPPPPTSVPPTNPPPPTAVPPTNPPPTPAGPPTAITGN